MKVMNNKETPCLISIHIFHIVTILRKCKNPRNLLPGDSILKHHGHIDSYTVQEETNITKLCLIQNAY